MDNIKKLIYGRNALDQYSESCRLKDCRSSADKITLAHSMSIIGMTLDEFYHFNFGMNLQEIDRCYRFRKIDNTQDVALCDSCSGRCAVACYTAICSEPGMEFLDHFSSHTPESMIAKEQTDKAAELNINLPFINQPACFLVTYKYGYTMPWCTGKSFKINEPMFDVTYKMDQLINHGDKVYQNMKANEVN